MTTNRTKPEVFIVESLEWEDEKENRFEGKILTEMLGLGGKHPLYYYVRTRRELVKVLGMFRRSKYRYLHLSCHGNSTSIATTLDNIKFGDLGQLLHRSLKGRRVFMSSCETVNDRLAAALIPKESCRSVSGPTEDVRFNDAAILWASFYHLAFNRDEEGMTGDSIRGFLEPLSELFGVPVAHYALDLSLEEGYRRCIFPKSSRPDQALV